MSQPTPTGGTTPGPVRVVLVDDHRMFRTGVRAELTEAMAASGVPVCEFIGEAPDVDTDSFNADDEPFVPTEFIDEDDEF